MRITRRRLVLTGVGLVLLLAAIVGTLVLPSLGAGGLLHPGRRPVVGGTPSRCIDTTFGGEGVTLEGWRCRSQVARRGTLVYLHGIADNRTSAAGLVPRFAPRGFDVIAYDSRAHGASTGEVCTYGYFEKGDLARVLDTVDGGPIVLMGTSLGAAVALQQAAADGRVTAVVAAEVFSDLRTVAAERAPFFFTSGSIRRAFELAEQQAGFDVDAVSPVAAAASIRIPVLLIHGAEDADTPPEHSRRVLAALAGSKRLIIVPGAGHNESLTGAIWSDIERWLDDVVPRPHRRDPGSTQRRSPPQP